MVFLFFAIFFAIVAVLFLIRRMNRSATQSTTYQPRTVLTPVVTTPAPPQIVVSHPGSPYYAQQIQPVVMHSPVPQPVIMHSPVPQQAYNVNIPSQPSSPSHYGY